MKIKQLLILLLITLVFVGCPDPEVFDKEDILSLNLVPLHEQFEDYFLIGNIFRGPSEITGSGAGATFNNLRLTRHFNAVTAENNMKPSYLVTGRNTTTGAFTWNTGNQTIADNFVHAANNAGMAVIGHTLLWHSQNAGWMSSQIASSNGTVVSGMTKEIALNIMREYITEVVSHFAGKIHTWDVLNEIFPDGTNNTNWRTAMRTANP